MTRIRRIIADKISKDQHESATGSSRLMNKRLKEKVSIGYHTTAAKLTEWKKEPEKAFLTEVSSVVLQQSLRNLDTAFTNFFEKRANYPTFNRTPGKSRLRDMSDGAQRRNPPP